MAAGLIVFFVLSLGLVSCSTARTKERSAGSSSRDLSLKIMAPIDGAQIKGNVVKLGLKATGIDIAKANGDTSGKTGHYHVFIDREPVAPGQIIPKAAGIVHSAKDVTLVTGLSVGMHTLAVVLGDGTHRRIGAFVARMKTKVSEPSVHVTGPKTAKAGAPVTIKVAVQGVHLVKAGPKTPKGSGHLHVLIDKEVPAAGTPIAKEPGILHTKDTTIKLPGMQSGDHTIWVVLGGGDHVPFDPPVMDKLVIVAS